VTGAVLVVTGTGTGVGKTVVVAAVAALAAAAGRRVAVLKPAQTGVADGEPGDLAEVLRLTGSGGVSGGHSDSLSGGISGGFSCAVTVRELGRYPDPLAPDTAARLSGRQAVTPAGAAHAAARLARGHDLVIVEGAGGLLVRFDADGGTLADLARMAAAPVLVVTEAGLGTLNATALTTEALRTRGLACAGLVVGSWPEQPDLAARCNLADLPVAAGEPLVGALPAGSAELAPDAFLAVARAGLGPRLGGHFDVTRLSPLTVAGAAD
jgi:dethiobiotin synthetase